MATQSSSSTNEYRFPQEWAYCEYIGVKLIPVNDRRLERVDLDGVKLPFYKGQKLYLLVKRIKCRTFIEQLQFKNPDRVLDRPTTEAAWMKLVTRFYQRWDPRPEAAEDDGFLNELSNRSPYHYKMTVLDEAKEQLKSEEVDQYWQNKAQEHPGLDIKSALEEMSELEKIEYGMWLLGQEPLPHEELTEIEDMILKIGTEDFVADEDKMEM